MGVDDLATRYPQLVQPRLPAFELGPVCAPERDVVQTRPVPVETVVGRSAGQRVQAKQVAVLEREHHVVEGCGVLVEHRFAAQQPPLPLDAGSQVGHRDRDVSDGRK